MEGTELGTLGVDRPDGEGETEDFKGMELDDAGRGVGWLSCPEAAGLGEEENGNREGVLVELWTGAEATAVNFSFRLTFTEEAEGGNEGFIPVFGALDIGVLSKVGLKPDDPKVKGAAGVAMEGAAGLRAWGPLEGGAKGKVEVPEPRAALGLSEPEGTRGGSPATDTDGFKDEGPKENTQGAPPEEGKGKVVVGTAEDTGARDKEASSGTSRFSGA